MIDDINRSRQGLLLLAARGAWQLILNGNEQSDAVPTSLSAFSSESTTADGHVQLQRQHVALEATSVELCAP